MTGSFLITGASGQVGSTLFDHLALQGGELHGIDLRPSRCATIVGDVRHATMPKADHVIHCAALVSVQGSLRDPVADAETNVLGTLHALEHARKSDASRFVYFSSAAVYGRPDAVPIREDHPTRPLSPYGASKLAGEVYTQTYAALYDLPIVVLRPFNIYSPRQDPTSPYSGVLAKFVDRVLSGRPPIVHGTGAQTRDFVHAEDVVRATLVALEKDDAVGRVFNVGSGRQTSIAELAILVADSDAITTSIVHEPGRPGEIEHSVADVSRLQGLGYAAEWTLERGVKDLLATKDRGPIA